jgi:hypothetical protein
MPSGLKHRNRGTAPSRLDQKIGLSRRYQDAKKGPLKFLYAYTPASIMYHKVTKGKLKRPYIGWLDVAMVY